MAKKPSNHVQTFLASLATDPDLLGELIQHPDNTLKRHNIRDKTTIEQIKKLLAFEVAKKLVLGPAVAYFIHW